MVHKAAPFRAGRVLPVLLAAVVMAVVMGVVMGVGLVRPAFPVRAAERLEDLARFDAASSERPDYGPWEAFLARYLTTGSDGITRVRYGAVSAEDHKALEGFLTALQAHDVTRLNRDEQFAFWANLYNAVTVDLILDHYPLASIRDITSGLFSTGPWKKKLITVNGHTLSLDDVEHGLLRRYWQDPRVHYAVNCASLGCPNLLPRAWRGATLDADLDAAARAYINSPRGARFEGNRLVVSSIYKWFREDFGGTEKGVLAHLRRYARPDLKARLKDTRRISRYVYDWRLNDTAGE